MAQAIILAGGLGQRLYPLTKDRPKWLLSLGDKTIADYQLEWLKENGISEAIVTLNKKHALVAETYPYPEGINANLIYEDESLGDEGGLKKALDYIKQDEVWIVNCDVITNFPLTVNVEAPALVLVHPKSPWGIYYDNGTFEEKPILKELWINGGIYKFPKSIKEELVDKGNLALNILPKLIREKRLKLIKFEGQWMGIETYKDLETYGQAPLFRAGE